MFEAERAFVNTAREGLKKARRAVADHDFEHAQSVMSDVSAAALAVRARGVAFCFDAAHDAASRADEAGALFYLGSGEKLITQYADGLTEIDTPENISIYAAGLAGRSECVLPALPQSSQEAPHLEAISAIEEESAAPAQEAAAALSGLLPHARPQERAALERLIAHAEQSNVDAPRRSQAKPAKKNEGENLPVEYMMAGLTDQVLGFAFRQKLQVSLSYHFADTVIASDALSGLREYMAELICARLSDMAGSRSIIHIALSAQNQGEQVKLSLVDGFDPEGALWPGIAKKYPALEVSGEHSSGGVDLTVRAQTVSPAQNFDDDPGDYLAEALA